MRALVNKSAARSRVSRGHQVACWEDQLANIRQIYAVEREALGVVAIRARAGRNQGALRSTRPPATGRAAGQNTVSPPAAAGARLGRARPSQPVRVDCAEEVDVLDARQGDVPRDLVVGTSLGPAHRVGGQAVVLGGPGDHRVADQGQAPRLLVEVGDGDHR